MSSVIFPEKILQEEMQSLIFSFPMFLIKLL